ncbi:MAG: hypothetical protein SGPRY_009330, partial [Prymnesium sp.]
LLSRHADFYRAFSSHDLPAMEALWDNSRRVTCVHPGQEAIQGWEEVVEPWGEIFPGPKFDVMPQQVRPRIVGGVAYVTCIETIGKVRRVVTNIVEESEGVWKLRLHTMACPLVLGKA